MPLELSCHSYNFARLLMNALMFPIRFKIIPLPLPNLKKGDLQSIDRTGSSKRTLQNFRTVGFFQLQRLRWPRPNLEQPHLPHGLQRKVANDRRVGETLLERPARRRSDPIGLAISRAHSHLR